MLKTFLPHNQRHRKHNGAHDGKDAFVHEHMLLIGNFMESTDVPVDYTMKAPKCSWNILSHDYGAHGRFCESTKALMVHAFKLLQSLRNML